MPSLGTDVTSLSVCLLINLPVFLLKGQDDLSAKLWDVSTGQCVYGIQTYTCAAVKFDEQKPDRLL